MKKFLLLSFWAITCNVYCQNIVFTDANFKAALINAGVDTNNDQEISQTEAAAVKDIKMPLKNINDINGIEYFINVTDLNIGHNNITSLNISKLTNLVSLSAAENQLTTIDLSHNLLLTGLDLQSDGLTCIDLSQHTHLISIGLNNNPMTGVIDVSKNLGLNECQVASCPNVTTICLPPAANITTSYGVFVKDASASWSKVCAANAGMTCSTTTAITKFSKGQFNVYPTLFSETFNLEIGESGTFDVLVIDLSGEAVSTATFSAIGTYSLGNTLSRGMYIVKINGMNKFQTFKIIKN